MLAPVPPVVAALETRRPTAEEAAGLRLLVAGLFRDGARRRLPTVLHAGRPGGSTADFVDLSPASLDAGLRVEVASAVLSRARSVPGTPAMWVSRAGEPTVEDVDQQWYAAGLAAYGEAGLPLLMVVVTRHGWYAPGSDLRQEWRRPRRRR